MLATVGCGPVVGIAETTDDAGASSTTDMAADFTEADSAGVSESGAPSPACGDGLVDPGEKCDDGNGANGDGCNVDCRASGELLWSVIADDPPGTNSYGYRVALSPKPEVILAVSRHRTGVAAGLQGYGIDGTELWQRDDLLDFPIEQVVGFAVGAAGETVLGTTNSDGVQTLAVVQIWDQHGNFSGSGYHTAIAGYSSYLASVSVDGLGNLFVSGNDSIASSSRYWIDLRDSSGTQRGAIEPTLQPLAIAGLGQGGAYVLFVANSDGFPLHRIDPAGNLVWELSSPCAGAIGVDAADTLTIIQTADPGLSVCRVAPDGSITTAPPVDIGDAYPSSLAVTRDGDIIVGGYRGGEVAAPWLGRISRAGELMWSHGPTLANSGLVLSVANDDALGLVVASGLANTAAQSHAFVLGVTP